MRTLTPTYATPHASAGRSQASVDRLRASADRPQLSVDRLLRCVSSGYMADGCSCQQTVPASVVSAAWARELERADVSEDQFFRFVWRGGAWLGYGLRDGRVRGVYCPTHSAKRAERSFVAGAGAACS